MLIAFLMLMGLVQEPHAYQIRNTLPKPEIVTVSYNFSSDGYGSDPTKVMYRWSSRSRVVVKTGGAVHHCSIGVSGNVSFSGSVSFSDCIEDSDTGEVLVQ